jgi:cytochrome P450
MYFDAELLPFTPRAKPSYRATVRNFLENYPPEAYRDRFFMTFPGLWPFVKPNHFLTDPELIEEVLVTRAEEFRRDDMTLRALGGPINREALFFAEGADWKWQHRAIAPAFRHENVLALAPTFSECAALQSEAWRRAASPALVDVMAAMSETTFSVIERAVLGAAGAIDRDRFLTALSPALDAIGWRRFIVILGLPPDWIPHPGSGAARRAMIYLRDETLRLLRERRAQPDSAAAPRRTILDLLLTARDPESGRAMTEAELVANLYGFMVAGHETSAVALAWALWLLAKDQASQTRAREEIAGVAGDAPIGAEALERLGFVRRVVQEAMRLFPPAAAIGRQPRADLQLGPYQLSRKEPLYVLTWCLHRHEKLWDNAGAFDPDRFLPERSKGRHRCAYLPFGAGPRICIGMGFALQEMAAILATLLRDWRFSTVPGHVVELQPSFTTRPRGGLPLRIEPARA